MKITYLILFSIILLSCKSNNEEKNLSGNSNIAVKDSISSETNNPDSEIINQKTEPVNVNCSKILIDLIKSSSIKNPFKNDLKVEIESKNSVNMKLRLFVEDGDNTVGWVIFDAENMRLSDITNDIENPIKLNFDKLLWNKIIDCSFNKDKSYYLEDENKSSNYKSCKTTTIEMGDIEECTFVNNTIERVYNDIIKNNEIEESDYLLKSIPKKNQIIKVNKSGLMSIEYKVSISKLNIELNYEGGVNSIQIEQIKDKVKRTITHSDD